VNLSYLSPQKVIEAAARLDGVAGHTPVMTSRTLDQLLGCHVFFKCENFQRVGAFKFRGAYNAISQLSEVERRAGVITHSSGNHAQGVALAARLLGVPATVVMPHDAPANKRAATEAYGATIIPCDALVREEVTQALIDEHGYTLVHPYDNDDIIAGQGTAALELFQEVGTLDALFVPVGGGGLISGSALAAGLLSPGCRVIGVEPARGPDAGISWRDNAIHKLADVPDTIADGLRTRAIGRRNLAIMHALVSDMTTATEEAILETLQYIWSRLKIIVEPSSAVALAPLFTGAYSLPPGSRVGVLLSGGNVDVASCGLFHHVGGTVASSAASASHAAVAEPILPVASANTLPRVLVCAPLSPSALARLEAHTAVEWLPDADSATLTRYAPDYQALILGPAQRLSGDGLKYAHTLRAIGLLADNLDNLDVSLARSLGIEVIQAPGSRAVVIAEHTVGSMLQLADKFGDGRLAGKTLGLIGYGRVGQQVAQRARAFDMDILVNQPRLTPELALEQGVRQVDLIDLLERSDFVSLHVPFRPETDTLIGEASLNRLKPNALLINSGHTDLIDDAALLAALNAGRLAGAAIPELPPGIEAAQPETVELRRHSRVLVKPHVTAVLDEQVRDTSVAVVDSLLAALEKRQSSELLDLKVVPVEQVVPHEHIDQKRVERLLGRLEDDGRLVNPPVTTFWKGRYIILDGATRYSALSQLGYPYVIVQVVQEEQHGFELHTWYHAISAAAGEAPQSTQTALFDELAGIEGLALQPISAEQSRALLNAPDTICYFIGRDGRLSLARTVPGHNKLAVMGQLVARYTEWGTVERTLLTDLDRLQAQFPELVAVAVFPQFRPSDVFDAAANGELLPAGLTRFVIPGRILRLNADLARLRQDEPLAAKRAWFDEFLAGKLSRSRLRYYQEPVVLLDE
jgi:threonine dehydratase